MAKAERDKASHNLLQQATIDHDVVAMAWLTLAIVPLVICIFMLIRQKLHQRWRHSLAEEDSEFEYEYMDDPPAG